jgi:iron complex transport system ATP-binding protein
MSLIVDNIEYRYGSSEVLKGVGFEVNTGEMIGILGPNGSGKTTLLKCINRILQPKSGTIKYNGKDLGGMSIKKLAGYMSFVPQDHGTPFPISVIDIILMGRIPMLKVRIREEDKNSAFAMLRLLELEALAFRKLNELSGGERQRVMIARALMQETPIIIMDEPTNNLDIKSQVEILHLIRQIVEKNGLIAVFALHDINLSAMFCHKIALIKDSRVFQSGPVHSVITEENLHAVYGVATQIEENSSGIHVRLLKPENDSSYVN